MTMDEFLKKHRIRMRVEKTERNRHSDDTEWGRTASHYICRYRRPGGLKFACYFSMGSAHVETPKAADVLDCLASDAAGFENVDGFEGWCGDYGYDTDSRRALRTYRVIERQARRLREFLGDGYQTLLWDVERL